MKKFFAIAAVAVMAFSTNAFAQTAPGPEGDAAIVSVTGRVIFPLDLTVVRNMVFPSNMVRSGGPYYAHDNSLTAEDIWDNNALLKLTGDENDGVWFSWLPTTTLTGNLGGTMTANLSPQWVYNVDPDAATYYANFAGYASDAVTSLNSAGNAWLLIDGSVSPTATQQRGLYTGSFTVTADYSAY